MAFILAGIIVVGTVALCLLILFADSMSDSPTTSVSPTPVAVVGFILAAILAASHWMPHIGW